LGNQGEEKQRAKILDFSSMPGSVQGENRSFETTEVLMTLTVKHLRLPSKSTRLQLSDLMEAEVLAPAVSLSICV
jgi:hypothetical protein